MSSFLKRRVVEPLRSMLRQGVTPHELALSLALAIAIGLIPILGVSTALCMLVALSLRLNLAAMQLVNYLLTPLQLLLIIPQLRLGEALVGAAPFPVTLESGLALIGSGLGPALRTLSTAIVHATLAWLLVAPLLVFALHRILRRVLTGVLRQSSSSQAEVTS